LDLAHQVIRLTGSSSSVIHQPLPSDDPKQRRPDISKAEALFHWKPRVSLEEGLKETIGYFKKIVGQKVFEKALQN
jgi:nucleoside-diphosphate-sugar epimerase